ncbi:hypothetical protein JOC86_000536 [Bacillus pakistanensis]|uniref:PilZ domain-containing protein n=1 Tax=Rossellomorea pakistanensis TaxID=992288 RepID=A0ABS2N8B2_9BACI|nr:hypothetical protein [Bacillus pakistanensis]MBM7583999.1 hypothetical protein [Bacillus pakistanensis]
MNTLTLPVSIEPQSIISLLKKQDEKANYYLERLVYYPYYFFKYKIKAKGLLKIDGYLGCTIDSISARGAIIDHSPSFIKEDLQNKACIPYSLTLLDAKNEAEDFLNHSASLKLKFFSIPKMVLDQQELFFRPYWIISDKKKRAHYPPIMIDAVSGKYHPLNM